MRFDLGDEFTGEHVEIDDALPDDAIVSIEAGVVRYLVRRIQAHDGQVALVEARLLDMADNLRMLAADGLR